jgi:TolA-binding protein
MNTEDNIHQKKLARLAELKQQIKVMEQKIDDLSAELIDTALKDCKSLESNGFKFFKRTYQGWKYSEDVELINEHLKSMRQKEREEGKAEPVLGKTYITIKQVGPSKKNAPIVDVDFEPPY